MNENEIGDIIIDSAIKLHMATGPGLFESVYEILLAEVLENRKLSIKRQVCIPVRLGEHVFKEGFRADIIVEGKVILELKSLETISSAHKKQLITYLKLSKLKLGYLLNFGAPRMVDGITRIINGTIR